MNNKENAFIKIIKGIGDVLGMLLFKYHVGLILIAIITALAFAISQS